MTRPHTRASTLKAREQQRSEKNLRNLNIHCSQISCAVCDLVSARVNTLALPGEAPLAPLAVHMFSRHEEPAVGPTGHQSP